MSGICGYVGVRDENLIGRMAAVLSRRETDEAGIFHRGGEYALGHRGPAPPGQTSIPQPFFNEDESVAAVCDGKPLDTEILRERLAAAGHVIKTDDPAETIAHAYEDHGIGCVEMFSGGFSFAIWDQNDYRMILARDRLGIKPLYYHLSEKLLLFASNTDAIKAYSGSTGRPDLRSLDQYLAYGFVSGERTFFEDIRQLPPAHFMICQRGNVRIERYWKPAAAADPPLSENAEDAEDDWLEELAECLSRSIAAPERDDGAFGVMFDAGPGLAVLNSLMKKPGRSNARFYSAFFTADENNMPDIIPDMDGRTHTAVPVMPDSFSLLPSIIGGLDEPRADPSILLADRLCESASKDVRVILTGECAEEIFGADAGTRLLLKIYRIVRRSPSAARRILTAAAMLAPHMLFGELYRQAGLSGLEGRKRLSAAMAGTGRPREIHQKLFSIFPPETRTALYAPGFGAAAAIHDPLSIGPASRRHHSSQTPARIIAGAPGRTYASLLPALQRIADSHGVEIRAPFADRRIAELAANMPKSLHSSENDPLQALLFLLTGSEKYPGHAARGKNSAYCRPGFEKTLKNLLHQYLNRERVRARGWFQPSAVSAVCSAAMGGRPMPLRQAFSLAILEMWCESHLD